MSLNKRRIDFFKLLFPISFLFLYFLYIFYFYVFPNNYNFSFIIIIGFALVVTSVFMFINNSHKKKNEYNLKFTLLSENSFKLLFIILMSISLVIAPITSPDFIILWNKVSFLNYFRAIIFLIGTAFLPGANLYNLFLRKKKIYEKFKIEPLILKITLYPLLSFSFIGIFVLILDYFGLIRELFVFFLFLAILFLFISDLLLQINQKKIIKSVIVKVRISFYSLIILILSFGFLLISVGIFFGKPYLIVGDSWYGVSPSNFIGHPSTSPPNREWGYPIFWGYICFGLSVLCGLPFINTNALMAPFCYIFVTSIYLLMRAILFELKEKYSVFAVILISIFSGLSFHFINLDSINPSTLTLSCGFLFFYKTYAYYLFFMALALFIISTKSYHNVEGFNVNIKKNNELIILIIASFFLVLSYMTYMIPLFMGLIFIFLYCISSPNKKYVLSLFSKFIILISFFFICFDILSEFYLSGAAYTYVGYFFKLEASILFTNFFISIISVYSILLLLCLISFLIQFIYSKSIFKKNNKLTTLRISHSNLFKLSYIIFTLFLIIYLISFPLETFQNFNLRKNTIFFFYLDNIFSDLGYIGIIAVYLSSFTFKKDKKLFLTLTSWIFASLFVASIFISFRMIGTSSFLLDDFEDSDFHWFGRNWLYSIIPLCVMASIGLVEISNKIGSLPRFKKIFEKRRSKHIFEFLSVSLLIYLSFTSTIVTGVETADMNDNIRNDQVKLIGWMSEELPLNTKVLLYDDDYNIRTGISVTFSYNIYYVYNIFESDKNYTELIDEVDYLKDKNIKYFIVTEDYLSENGDEIFFVKTYLIPNFYNETEYETGDYRLYYAPYFDD